MKPSLKSLIDRARSTLIQKTGTQNPAIDAIAAAIGGANYGQYGYQDYLFQQLHPETANEEWLALWATRLNRPRTAATFASGTVSFAGAQLISEIPSGVILKSQDGLEFETTELTPVTDPVPVSALKAGSESNLGNGVTLYLVSAVTGLNPDTITVNSISGGSEIETLENWRARVVTAYNERSSVGRLSDYEAWAITAHPEIEFAKAKDNTPNTGNVTVYIGAKDQNPIVSETAKNAATAYLNEMRIAGCHLYAEDITPLPINIILSDVADLETRTNIESTLQTYIESRMGDDESITPGQLVIEISKVTDNFSLVSPVSSTTPLKNEVVTIGSITWQ